MLRTKLNLGSIRKVCGTQFSSTAKPSDHFYLTTPIFYVNSRPHLGHLYTLVVSDAYFRFQKLLGRHKHYVFATGTDEHGLKIQEAAKAASMDCKEFCDLNAGLFRELCEQFSISNTHFIRTTDERHKRVVHKVWNELDRGGFIYKTNYEGWYSVSDEAFVPNKQVRTVDEYRREMNSLISQRAASEEASKKTGEVTSKETGEVTSKETGEQTSKETDEEEEIANPVEMLKFLDQQLTKTALDNSQLRVDLKTGNLLEHSEESNYIFKLENVRERLVDLIKNSERFITPDRFRNVLLNMIESDTLGDVSISRAKSRFSWGITVPGDEQQIIYVWFDALCNYLTVANYDSPADFHWPPSIQVLGKDIIKFHAIYWPAFLYALGLQVPAKLHCHAHWLINDMKMSKSKGNVVNPFDYLDLFKADGIRYFLLKTGAPHADGNFSDKKLREYVNADLADTLGNLLQRSTNLKLNAKQCFPSLQPDQLDGGQLESNQVASELLQQLNELPDRVLASNENGNFHLGIVDVMAVLHKCNKLFFEQEPWKLVKSSLDEDQRRLQAVLWLTYETLRISAILLSPIIPNCAETVLHKLNIPADQRSFHDCKLIRSHADSQRRFSQEKAIVYEKIFI